MIVSCCRREVSWLFVDESPPSPQRALAPRPRPPRGRRAATTAASCGTALPMHGSASTPRLPSSASIPVSACGLKIHACPGRCPGRLGTNGGLAGAASCHLSPTSMRPEPNSTMKKKHLRKASEDSAHALSPQCARCCHPRRRPAMSSGTGGATGTCRRRRPSLAPRRSTILDPLFAGATCQTPLLLTTGSPPRAPGIDRRRSGSSRRCSRPGLLWACSRA